MVTSTSYARLGTQISVVSTLGAAGRRVAVRSLRVMEAATVAHLEAVTVPTHSVSAIEPSRR